MPFYTGTITGGGGAGLRAKVEECLTANSPVWTQKSLGNTASYAWTLWENDGSHAWAGGRKWYLLLASTATDLRIAVAEEYDAVNGLVGATTRNVSGSITLDSLGRKSGYSALASTGTFYNNLYLTNIPTSATYTYWIVVTPEGVFMRHSNDSNTNAYCYAGLFESALAPLVPGSPTFDFPLAVVSTDRAQADCYSVFTRAPGRGGVSLTYPFTLLATVPFSSSLGTLPTGHAALGGKALLTRIGVYHGYSTCQYAPRGHLPDWLLQSGSLDAGVAVNDTITVNGATHRCMHTNDRLWMREVA